MRHINMYANVGVNMLIKHKTKSFYPFCKTKHICINNKEDKYYSPLSNENMHIYTQILLPLFVNHQQRG